MKNIILTIFVFCLFAFGIASCYKCDKCPEGIITGFDETKCACCGGYMMTINGQQFLTQINLAEKFPLLNTADYSFPLAVSLKFTKETGECGNGKRIVVSEIDLK